MKSNFCFRIEAIVFLTIFAAGCSPVNTSLLDFSPTTLPTPTRQNYSQESANQIIKAEGWQIPLPEKKTQAKTSVRSMKSDDGNTVEVTLTHYFPASKFIYNEGTPDSNNTAILLVKGELELADFTEFKVNNSIFSYTIFARKNKTGKDTNNNSSHEPVFGYRILDKDGDGKFETLINESSETLVPRWVLR